MQELKQKIMKNEEERLQEFVFDCQHCCSVLSLPPIKDGLQQCGRVVMGGLYRQRNDTTSRDIFNDALFCAAAQTSSGVAPPPPLAGSCSNRNH